MAGKSTISWTDRTLNAHWGCTRVSPGCVHCYAEDFAARFGELARFVGPDGKRDARWTGEVRYYPNKLRKLAQWEKTPGMVFVNSMSDFFHEAIPLEQQRAMMAAFVAHPALIYQILTKRSERMAGLAPQLEWPWQVAMGVSIESRNYLHRIDHLRTVPARWRFLSIEPLLGALPKLNLQGIHWVIVGGESGPHARPCAIEWIEAIVRQCREEGVAVFVKQLGTFPRYRGRPYYAQGWAKRIKGEDQSDWPASIKVREYPEEWLRHLGMVAAEGAEPVVEKPAKTQPPRSAAALKAWETRRKNALKSE